MVAFIKYNARTDFDKRISGLFQALKEIVNGTRINPVATIFPLQRQLDRGGEI
jgi:hypothetical protein